MVVRKGRSWHRRAEHHVPLAKKLPPLLLEPGPCRVGREPIAVADHRTARALGSQAPVVRRKRFGLTANLCVDTGRQSCPPNRRQQPHIESCGFGEIRKQGTGVRNFDSGISESLRQSTERRPYRACGWTERMVVNEQDAKALEIIMRGRA